jgi:t-SNARE complex subunit (syntaxin)
MIERESSSRAVTATTSTGVWSQHETMAKLGRDIMSCRGRPDGLSATTADEHAQQQRQSRCTSNRNGFMIVVVVVIVIIIIIIIVIIIVPNPHHQVTLSPPQGKRSHRRCGR